MGEAELHKEWRDQCEQITAWEDAVSLATTLVEKESLTQWHLGDLANRVARLNGRDPLIKEKVDTLKKFAKEVRIPFSTVRQAAKVSEAVEPGLRATSLSFTHYRVIVRKGMLGDDITRWLQAAEDGNWTTPELERRLNEEAGKQRAVQPKRAAAWLATFSKRLQQYTWDEIEEALDQSYDADGDQIITDLPDAKRLLGLYQRVVNKNCNVVLCPACDGCGILEPTPCKKCGGTGTTGRKG